MFFFPCLNSGCSSYIFPAEVTAAALRQTPSALTVHLWNHLFSLEGAWQQWDWQSARRREGKEKDEERGRGTEMEEEQGDF